MKFYCVNAEFYDNFDEDNQVLFTEVKACITTSQKKVKPKNQFRQFYGMVAFKLWFESEVNANLLLEKIKSGVFGVNQLAFYYNDCLKQKGKVAA